MKHLTVHGTTSHLLSRTCRWLLPPRVTSHNVSLQSPRLNVTQEQETSGEFPSAEPKVNRSGEARGSDAVAARALAGEDIVMDEAPASTGSELDGVRAPRSLAPDAGVCTEAETGGRVEDEANSARAFAVAEMVGSKGWGSREDEIGTSKRWAALMQAFGSYTCILYHLLFLLSVHVMRPLLPTNCAH